MAITQVITAIPTAGHRGVDARETFVTKQEAFQDALVDNFVTEINVFKTQANDLETNVNAKEASAVNAKEGAESARDSAFLTANVTLWVSGNTYTIGQNVVSPVDFKTYVRKTNGSGTTDPSIDGTNYDLKTAPDNTKLPLSGGTMTGAITGLKETSVAMTANNIDLSLGNYFTKTISTATTLTVSNVPTSGTVGYFILELTNGGAGAVTYPTGTKWSKGTAPTLTAAGIDLLRFVTIDGGVRFEASRIQEDSK